MSGTAQVFGAVVVSLIVIGDKRQAGSTYGANKSLCNKYLLSIQEDGDKTVVDKQEHVEESPGSLLKLQLLRQQSSCACHRTHNASLEVSVLCSCSVAIGGKSR